MDMVKSSPLILDIFCSFFKKKDFICLLERERAQAGEAAGRGRRSGLSTERGARCGTRSQDVGIMT